MSAVELIETRLARDSRDWLGRIRMERVHLAQQAGLMRLQLYLTGETHRILGEAAGQIVRLLLRGGENEPLDAGRAWRVQSDAAQIWIEAMRSWTGLLGKLRAEAASLAFGGLAVELHWLASKLREAMEENHRVPRRGLGLREAVRDGVFTPQLQLLIQAANEHIYADGLNLSARLWRLEHETYESIQRILFQAIQNGDSAWDTAKKLETFLGANQDCPRWTATRLYRTSKTDIALGKRTGLMRGEACAGQGVAYNALRLARNEIQHIHHSANDQLMAQTPWIEKEQVLLSAQHPPLGCICEQVVAGGEDGKGIYPVGEVRLPLHVGCLCFKVAQTLPDAEFTRRLRGWVRGEESWAAMDRFADQYAPVRESDPVAMALGVWVFGNLDEILGRLK